MTTTSGISPDRLYPYRAAQKAAGLGDVWFRERRNDPEHPLPTLYVGRTAFVRGADLIAAIERVSTPERPSTAGVADVSV